MGRGVYAGEMRIEPFILIRKRGKKVARYYFNSCKRNKSDEIRTSDTDPLFFFLGPMILHRFVEALIERPHDSDV